nr:peroxiredoxin-like family protein [Stieleria tagensis]
MRLIILALATVVAAVGMAQTTTPEPLAPKLQELVDGASKRYPPEVLSVFKDGVQTVKATGIEQSARQVGQGAIDAELAGWDGKNVRLSELWKQGPVVLMWYRGGWCPYCNVQLRAMQHQLSAIEGAGAKLVVLTPELPEKAKQTAEANDLDLVALHDKDNALAKQYGIVFDLPAPIIPMYRDRLKLGSYNGNDKMELPLSATYVIDRNGKITYAYLNADYTKRAEPAEVLAAVQAIAPTTQTAGSGESLLDDYTAAEHPTRQAMRGDWEIKQGIASVKQDDALYKKFKNHGPIMVYPILHRDAAAVVEFKPQGCKTVVFTMDAADGGHAFRVVLRTGAADQPSTIQTYTEKPAGGKAKPIVLSKDVPHLDDGQWQRIEVKVQGERATVSFGGKTFDVQHPRIAQPKKIVKLGFSFGELAIRSFELDQL